MKNVSAEIQIDRIKEVAAHSDGRKIVVRAEALHADERTEFEIAVTTELAPGMAFALLQTTAKSRAKRDELDPALDVFGAAVVCSSSAEKVRLQLIFEKGALLPLELTVEAARALSRGLATYLASEDRRLAPRRDRITD